jgi:hypothetical protein
MFIMVLSFFYCFRYTEYRVFFVICPFSLEKGFWHPSDHLAGVGSVFFLRLASYSVTRLSISSAALAYEAILFLQQAGQYIELAGSPIQVVVGEFAPPGFGLAPDLFPLACKYILV